MAKHSHTSKRRRAKNGTESRQWLDSNCKRIGKKVRYFYYSASLFPSLVHSFTHSLARTKDTLTIAIAFLKAAPVTIKPLKRFKVYSRSKSNALLCSLARSIGRLVSFHFISLRARSTARHGTHNLQIQTNRTLHTIEQTGLEQKQPAKLRTAPKLTLFPSSSLSNALLPLQTCQHLGQLCVLLLSLLSVHCKSKNTLDSQ